MLDAMGIHTWGEFMDYMGCVVVVAAVVIPIAVILWFGGKIIIKILVKGLDKAYGCVVESKYNNNKRKKGK